jgi:hypothetical protein
MKFTIPTYLVLLACLATALGLPMDDAGVAIHDQNDTTTSDSFSGAYIELTRPTITLQPGTYEAVQTWAAVT